MMAGIGVHIRDAMGGMILKIDDTAKRLRRRPRLTSTWLDRYRPVHRDVARPTMISRPKHLYQWAYHFSVNDNAILIAPPGHGKTWTMQDLIIKEICEDRNTRWIWASKTKSEAMKAVANIRDVLTYDKKIKRDYGEFATKEWGSERFKVQRTLRGALAKEFTLQAIGLGGQLEGTRLAGAVLDDIIDITSMVSETYRKRAIEWLQNVLFARMDPGAKLWIIGSRWHHADAYAFLQSLYESFPEAACIQVPAVYEDGSLLAPDMCGPRYIARQKERMGIDAFNLRYNQMAADRRGLPFPEIQIVTRGEILGSGIRRRYWGADWNASEKESSHLTALVAVSVLVDKRIVIDSCMTGHMAMGYDDWVKEQIPLVMSGACRDFRRPDVLRTEAYNFQYVVAKAVANRFDIGIPVETVGRITPKNVSFEDKLSKYDRIVTGMQGWIASGVLVAYADGPGMVDFLYDLNGFPNVMYDDRLDAAQRAVRRALDFLADDLADESWLPEIR